MKLGDLVNYTGKTVAVEGQGLIIGGPKRDFLEHYSTNPQWQVFWAGQRNADGSSKIGWWDEARLEVVDESR